MISATNIETALVAKLQALNPTWTQAYSGLPFTPNAANPYQKGHLLPARPGEPSWSKGTHWRQRGVFQVSLFYPVKQANVRSKLLERAELVKDWFYPTDNTNRGLTSGSTTVIIEDMPYVHQIFDGTVHSMIPVDIFWRVEDSPV